MRNRRVGPMLVVLLLAVLSAARPQAGPFVSLSVRDVPLPTVLQQIADQSRLAIEYDPGALADCAVTIELDQILATSALKLVCQDAGCTLTRQEGGWRVEAGAGRDPVAMAREMAERGDYGSAEEVLEARLEVEPDDVAALSAMADLRCVTREFADAQALVARLQGLGLEDPKQLAAIDVLDGRAKAGLREFEAAFAAFGAALERDPDCLEAYVERAKLHEARGEYGEAAADWRAYLERDDTSPMAQAVRLGCVVVEDRLVRHDGNSPTWSPDGKTVAYVAHGGASVRNEIRMMDVETGADRLLFAGDGSFKWCLDWSPDGRYIAWEVRRRDPENGERTMAVEVLDVETQEVQVIERPYRVYYPRWHPDGLEILTFTLDQPYCLETMAFGIDEPRLYFEPQLGATYAYADWSPDGKQIITSWNQLVGENYSLYVADVEDPLAPHKRLMEHDGSCRIRVACSPDGRLIAYLRSFEQYIYMLYAIRGDGTGEEMRLTSVTERTDGILGFGWAPDSRRIAYGTWDSKLHILRLGGLIEAEATP